MVTSTINAISKPDDYAGTGRVSALTDELQVSICDYIASGNYLITSCRAVGISDVTFRNWCERGKTEEEAGNTEGRFLAFLSAVKKAEAVAEAERVSRIAVAGVGGALTKRVIITQKDGSTREEEQYAAPQWLADMTHLERRHPERWARPAPINQQGGGNTYNINIEKAIVDAAGKFDAVMARLAERTAAPLAIPADAPVIESPIYKEGDGTSTDVLPGDGLEDTDR